MRKSNVEILVIVMFVLAVTLPFINKAYHIDDAAFLFIADQIGKDPLHPYSFIAEWGNGPKQAIFLNDTPFLPYLIALLTYLLGRKEWILHLVYIIFPLTAAISFYFFAKKFLKKALIPALIMVAMPTFLPNAHNLMFDVPVLAAWMLAITLFVYGVDKNNHKLMLSGSIVAGICYWIKPTGAIIIFLIALYCILAKKYKYISYIIVPVLFILLFALQNYIFEKDVIASNYASQLIKNKNSIELLSSYIFGELSYIGGATVFPLFFIYPLIRRKRAPVIMSLSALVSIAASYFLWKFSVNFVSGRYSLFEISLFFVFVTCSLFFIIITILRNFHNTIAGLLDILRVKKSKYDAALIFIFLWFIGALVLNSVIVGGAVRFNTILLPPLILLYFLQLQESGAKNLGRIASLILVSTLIIGLSVAYADYEFANAYRNFVKSIPETYKTSANEVRFSGGAEFQYYMMEKGYKIMQVDDNTPKKGDVVIKVDILFLRKMSEELLNRSKLAATVSYSSNFPVRVQNPDAHAGFYTYAGGLLPFSFSDSGLETFRIYAVEKEAKSS